MSHRQRRLSHGPTSNDMQNYGNASATDTLDCLQINSSFSHRVRQETPANTHCVCTLAGSVMSSVPEGRSSPGCASSPLWPFTDASSLRSWTNCSVVRRSRGKLFCMCSLNLRTVKTSQDKFDGLCCDTLHNQSTVINPSGVLQYFIDLEQHWEHNFWQHTDKMKLLLSVRLQKLHISKRNERVISFSGEDRPPAM